MTIYAKEKSKFELSTLIGIPVVGFLLTLVFREEYFELYTIQHFIHILFSIFITGVSWLGCQYIVIKLWKKYPWHLKPKEHILVEVPLLIVFTLAMMLINSLLFKLSTGNSILMEEFVKNTIIILIVTFALVTFNEAMFFYYQWQENFNKSTLLEKTRLKAEYDLLKSQVNPHFLFNSLNTLTTYVDDNEVAVKYIQTLSDFLRYSLEDKNSGNRTLAEEIDIVEKYIQLQKYRFDDNLSVHVAIDEKHYAALIPSLAVLTLVENAVKHNVISKLKPLTIGLLIEGTDYLIVENNFQPRDDVESTKQGLLNLGKRLSFISEKELITRVENGKFIVKLPLTIEQ